MSHSIAISADYGYLNAAEALIKSIAYNNHNEKIYLLNTNIPQEWFVTVNQKLSPINVKIIDTKFAPSLLEREAVSRGYMNQMIYGRILIPRLVPEDRVLYLDADTIVNGSLKELFKMDMEGHPVAAVEDFTMANTFNSGVLLIDNNRLKEDPSFTDSLLAKGEESTSNDDQTLLNDYFRDQWLRLPNGYNYQIGLDSAVFYTEPNNLIHYNKMLKESKPRLIIHYSTADKPWNFTSSSRMRDKWWQYSTLDYSEIIHHRILPTVHPTPKASFFTFTSSENLSHLEDLLKAFPEYDFNVLAWTAMGDRLLTLTKYSNLHLYPMVIGATIDSLINKADAYLDINYGDKEFRFINHFVKAGKPLIAFEDTAGDSTLPSLTIFENNNIDGVINKIREIAENK
ncbi:glycosyltransferase [Lactobacillaceae bacterium 24-114]